MKQASQAQNIQSVANDEEKIPRRFQNNLKSVSSSNSISLTNLQKATNKSSITKESSTTYQFLSHQGENPKSKSHLGITDSPSNARKHLSAYLQEACFWAAQKAYHRFKLLQHKYSLEEYFQIANTGVNPPEKIFKNFNLEYSHTNIEGYAKTAIVRWIGNTIYKQDLEAKRDKFSDLGLLKDVSHKEIREALVDKGLNSAQINFHSLVWQCFDEIFQPTQSQGSSRLETLNERDLQQIVNYYNFLLKRIDVSAVTVSEEKVKEMLATCIQSARDSRTKRFIPLENSENIFDFKPTPLDIAIQEEEREQVQSLVAKLFEEIPEIGQILLKLWQGLNLTQTEMASVLEKTFPELQKQYQVARHLARYNNAILKNFVTEWNQIYPSIFLSSDRDIEKIKDSLSECLQSYCKKNLYTNLNRILKKYNCNKRDLAINHKLNVEKDKTSDCEVRDRIEEVRKYLIKTFCQELEISMNMATGSLKVVSHRIAFFVDEWLQNLEQ
ncbi:sigma-70 family RNA polymerase sigma factor [Scytonema sp. NUACC26]|uniref:sigma-70 family RNA polymerase sigma factor n=1 Tax=Scytonema sp. NUACC26 TaxID=3140176 RepID=UPI0038B3D1F5